MKPIKTASEPELQSIYEKICSFETIQKDIIGKVIDALISNEITISSNKPSPRITENAIKEQFKKIATLSSDHKEIVIMILQGLILQNNILSEVNTGNIRFGQNKFKSQ